MRILSMMLALLGTVTVAVAQSNSFFGVISGQRYCTISGNCVSSVGSQYGNSERCTINLLVTGQLASSRFSTESGYDYVTINGRRFSGTSYLNVMVSAGQQMSWYSDGSVTRSGWTICYESVDTTTTITSTISTALVSSAQSTGASRYLRINSGLGDCTLSSHDILLNNCVTSGFNYGHNERCSVTILASGSMYYTRFNTENCCDSVNIDGRRYSGTTGPMDQQVTTGDVLTWLSDTSVTRSGWTICFSPGDDPFALSIAPSIAPTPSEPFSITSGSQNCELSTDNCISTGFGNYGNYESCTVTILRAGTLQSVWFSVAEYNDRVTINGLQFKGTTGPNNFVVSPGDTLEWYSDGSYTGRGWKICYSSDTPSSSSSGTDDDPVFPTWIIGIVLVPAILFVLYFIAMSQKSKNGEHADDVQPSTLNPAMIEMKKQLRTTSTSRVHPAYPMTSLQLNANPGRPPPEYQSVVAETSFFSNSPTSKDADDLANNYSSPEAVFPDIDFGDLFGASVKDDGAKQAVYSGLSKTEKLTTSKHGGSELNFPSVRKSVNPFDVAMTEMAKTSNTSVTASQFSKDSEFPSVYAAKNADPFVAAMTEMGADWTPDAN